MLGFNKSASAEALAKISLISSLQAVIEFNMDGTIITANENFLQTMGYALGEIKGKHHRMFVEPDYAKTMGYSDFWTKLNEGESFNADFRRVGKNGKEVWIKASYSPLLNRNGKPYKVVKYATEITSLKLENADYIGQLAAIGKSQAVIQFNLDGTIITANENFLKTMGYTLDEVKGKHHSMFVDPAHVHTAEYGEFWAKLNRGEYQSAEYRRIGKGGREIWILASYNPILDMNGKPFKVVKYATAVTEQKLANADYTGQIAAIGKSQAVIHFNLDGTIINANENFLGAMGYTAAEIEGRHHSMFVQPAYAQSQEYKDFWAKLNRGEYQSAEYQRIGKGGRTVWIMASYNPILDMNGRPFKVVKYASDITAQMQARLEAASLVTQALSNIQGVAAAAEEMTSSISEISKNMVMSKKAVEDIVEKTATADDASKQLANTSKSMEGVVELIRNIAGQVNLLALNATIEAARAGDAGKGFAVVASEVKNLANQTTQATDDIAKEINAMQSVSQMVTTSVNAIGAATSSVSEYVGGVAGAIEEQSAVTREISANMQQASQGIAAISECVKKIAG